LHHGPRLLRVFDHDLGTLLAEEMRKKGIAVHLDCTLAAIERTEGGHHIMTGYGRRIETRLVMYAVGRRPNVEGLGLERVGVEQRQDGAIVVDNFSRTTVPHIYAIGDVTHRLQLTPVAIREGQAFAETVFNRNPQEMSYENVATAIFCQPPIGTVGLSEDEAHRRHEAVDIYETSFRPLKHTLTGRDEKTYMKLVVSRHDERVRGCHILGADAAEMIQCVAIALKMGATKRDFDATVAVHPTAAEELVTLRRKRSSRALP
jgi:glutathione reductase (NADPH)